MLDAGDLRDASLGREIAFEDREMTLRIHRSVPLTNDGLVLARRVGNLGEVFRDGAAR
jgi:hypothetical protein